ncbi:hypothetical protein EYF80_046456 [Liparis tanakae]|uniref:Uncharacterized protein n=1 Tax=Liparis tanakae TaxID=230148 RepID=A0A4Z2FQC3_9TELE|nr:hypothetical protein EYF80_046456 [Liparis tanakae]
MVVFNNSDTPEEHIFPSEQGEVLNFCSVNSLENSFQLTVPRFADIFTYFCNQEERTLRLWWISARKKAELHGDLSPAATHTAQKVLKEAIRWLKDYLLSAEDKVLQSSAGAALCRVRTEEEKLCRDPERCPGMQLNRHRTHASTTTITTSESSSSSSSKSEGEGNEIIKKKQERGVALSAAGTLHHRLPLWKGGSGVDGEKGGNSTSLRKHRLSRVALEGIRNTRCTLSRNDQRKVKSKRSQLGHSLYSGDIHRVSLAKAITKVRLIQHREQQKVCGLGGMAACNISISPITQSSKHRAN